MDAKTGQIRVKLKIFSIWLPWVLTPLWLMIVWFPYCVITLILSQNVYLQIPEKIYWFLSSLPIINLITHFSICNYIHARILEHSPFSRKKLKAVLWYSLFLTLTNKIIIISLLHLRDRLSFQQQDVNLWNCSLMKRRIWQMYIIGLRRLLRERSNTYTVA